MIRNCARIAFRNFTKTNFTLFRKVDDINAGHEFLPAFASILANKAHRRDQDQYATTLPLNKYFKRFGRSGPVLPIFFPRFIVHLFQNQNLRRLSRCC